MVTGQQLYCIQASVGNVVVFLNTIDSSGDFFILAVSVNGAIVG